MDDLGVIETVCFPALTRQEHVLGAVIGYGILKLIKGKVNAFREKDWFL